MSGYTKADNSALRFIPSAEPSVSSHCAVSIADAHDGLGDGDEISAVLAMHPVDRLTGLVEGPVELGPRVVELGLELENLLHTGEADALVGELLDPAEQHDVTLGVPAAATLRTRRLDQALALVDAQRLRMHAGELRGHRDDVQRPLICIHVVTPPSERVGWRAAPARALPPPHGPRLRAPSAPRRRRSRADPRDRPSS